MKQETDLAAGDHVELVGLGGRWFEVINADDSGLVRLKTDDGKEFLAGWQCVSRKERRGKQ